MNNMIIGDFMQYPGFSPLHSLLVSKPISCQLYADETLADSVETSLWPNEPLGELAETSL